MILFIASEVMFFVAWFWVFFDAACSTSRGPSTSRASSTPAASGRRKGVEVFDPWHLPLVNTLILLTSGTTVTWAHHALQHGDRKGAKKGLMLTVLLGALFTAVQAYEYSASRPFFFRRQLGLRLDLLHGDRLPRLPRADRHHLPAGLPAPR